MGTEDRGPRRVADREEGPRSEGRGPIAGRTGGGRARAEGRPRGGQEEEREQPSDGGNIPRSCRRRRRRQGETLTQTEIKVLLETEDATAFVAAIALARANVFAAAGKVGASDVLDPPGSLPLPRAPTGEFRANSLPSFSLPSSQQEDESGRSFLRVPATQNNNSE